MIQPAKKICDACGNAIDAKNGSLAFIPLRGGLAFTATSTLGSASTDITTEVNLCGPDCLTAWAEKTIAAIKPASSPAK